MQITASRVLYLARKESDSQAGCKPVSSSFLNCIYSDFNAVASGLATAGSR